MSRQSRAKLVPPKMEPANQALKTIEESSVPEQKEEPVLSEIDTEIECHDAMRLWNCAPASITWYTVVRAAVFC